MGIDYDSCSGLAGTYSDMTKLITKDNYRDLLTYLKSVPEFDEEVLGDIVEGVDSKLSYSEFKKWLDSIHETEGEAGKYGGDICLKNGLSLDSITNLWNEILEGLVIELPYFDCNLFDSYRHHEGCPFGEVAFIFDEDACYSRKINKVGSDLKALIGDLDQSHLSWTDEC